MVNRTAATSLLRQCTASVSAAAVARRSAAGVRGRALVLCAGLRPYSTTQNGQNGNEEKKEEEMKEEEKKENGTNGEEKSAEAEKEGETKPEETTTQKEGDDVHAECLKNLKAKEDEVVDLTGRLRYLQADFLNLQRNAAREKEQTRDFAITRFAGDLLETVDVLQLALKSVPDSALKLPTPDNVPTPSAEPTPESMSIPETSTQPTSEQPAQTKTASDYLRDLHHGVEMTHRLLLQTLFKYGVKPFDPTGDPFNPNRHEALYQVPIPGKKPGTVVDCQKTGYTIKDRTLRAAQVGVASEPSNPPAQS